MAFHILHNFDFAQMKYRLYFFILITVRVEKGIDERDEAKIFVLFRELFPG